MHSAKVNNQLNSSESIISLQPQNKVISEIGVLVERSRKPEIEVARGSSRQYSLYIVEETQCRNLVEPHGGNVVSATEEDEDILEFTPNFFICKHK